MKHSEPVQLKTSKVFDVRFSEVDAMNIVWHGSYALYFEDAREQFGKEFGLSYMSYFDNGYYAPLVELNFSFKKPLLYGQQARIDIIFRNVPAAKVIFDYEIRLITDMTYSPLEGMQEEVRTNTNDNLVATGSSTQVFLDNKYNLVWINPPFYETWKRKHNLL